MLVISQHTPLNILRLLLLLLSLSTFPCLGQGFFYPLFHLHSVHHDHSLHNRRQHTRCYHRAHPHLHLYLGYRYTIPVRNPHLLRWLRIPPTPLRRLRLRHHPPHAQYKKLVMHQLPNHRPPSPLPPCPNPTPNKPTDLEPLNTSTHRQFLRIRHRHLPSRESKRHRARESSRILLLPRKTQREPRSARHGDPE